MSELMKAEPRATVADVFLSGVGARCEPRRTRASRETWAGVFAEILGARPARILDVGSGAGEAALVLHDLGHYPHGVDADAEQVRRARDAAAERCAAVPFHVGDAEQLDFPAGAFDAVHVRDLLGSLPHPMWALAEWFRVLRPGGTLVVVERAASDRAVADGLPSSDFLRAGGFTDIRTRDVALPSPSAGASWLRRLPFLAPPRCSIAWGRRD